MDHSKVTLVKMVKEAFQYHRPNTSRMYASRLKSLATKLGIPWAESDIMSPQWLENPGLVMLVLMQQRFSLNTIRSYLTAVASYLQYLSFRCSTNADRATAWVLMDAYRAKQSVIPSRT